jgi:malate dehydrogenase
VKISIVGATGHVGSSAAFNIAIHRLADEIVLIGGSKKARLLQYVEDLNTAVTGLDVLVRMGGYEDMRDSKIVIIAAGSAEVIASRMEVLPQNLPLIHGIAQNVKQFCPESIVITATNPVCPLNYAMYLSSHLDRKKLIGYSANDSIRFRMFLSQALGVKSSQVEGTVIGEHGNSQVMLFSSVKVNGKRFAVNDQIKQKIRQQAAMLPALLEDLRMKSGRTASWTASMGLTALCHAIKEDTGEMIPCSLVLDGEYGCHQLGMTVPAIIGMDGVQQIQEWELSPDEREALNRSINILKPAMRYVEEFLTKK